MWPPRVGRLVCRDLIESKQDQSGGEPPYSREEKASVEAEQGPAHEGAQRRTYFDRFLEVEGRKFLEMKERRRCLAQRYKYPKNCYLLVDMEEDRNGRELLENMKESRRYHTSPSGTNILKIVVY